jgi:hypothetical protein
MHLGVHKRVNKKNWGCEQISKQKLVMLALQTTEFRGMHISVDLGLDHRTGHLRPLRIIA